MSQPRSAKNFRDLGGIAAHGGSVRRGRLFRTAHLSSADESLAAELVETHAIRTYIDFRTDAEIERDGVPAPLIQKGVRWERRPFDLGDETFYALTLPGPDDWCGLYERGLERFRAELSSIVHAIASEPAPLVFGCWAGKDRTGIVAACVLSLLGAADEAIAADYARTTEGLAPHADDFSFLWRKHPERREEFFRSYCVAPAHLMQRFLGRLRSRHGSVHSALDVPESVASALREAYVVP